MVVKALKYRGHLMGFVFVWRRYRVASLGYDTWIALLYGKVGSVKWLGYRKEPAL